MRQNTLVYIIACAALATPAAAQTVLDNAQMIAVGSAEAAYAPKDAFTPRPDETPMIGRNFRLTLPLEEEKRPSLLEVTGGWSYDVDHSILHLSVPVMVGFSVEYLGGSIMLDRPFRTITFDSQSVKLGSEVGQTALGVRFNYNVYTSTQLSVGQLTPPSGTDLFSSDLNIGLTKDVLMAPAEARRAVEGVEVVIEGRTVAFAPGRVTACETTREDATLDMPMETIIKSCVLNAVIDRVAIDSPTGGIMAEWKAAPGQ